MRFFPSCHTFRLVPCFAARAWVLAFGLSGTAAAVHAHDTWFAARAVRLPGTLVMALGTGNLYPKQEFPIGAEQLRQQGCRQRDRAVPLQSVAVASTALLMQARTDRPDPVTCWAQLMPFEVELEGEVIGVYLDEINASDAVRQRWAELARRGLKWKERYTKNARIEFGGTNAPAASERGEPAPISMDLVLQGGPRPVRPGEKLVFQVLRDGAPLPMQALELRGTGSAPAVWVRSDATGLVSIEAGAPGWWALRGTDLRPSAQDPDRWESWFVNVVFEVTDRR